MRGAFNIYMYLFLVIVLGITLLVFTTRFLDPLQSATGESEGIAIAIGLNTDSLSSVGTGSMKISMQKSYDIKIEKIESTWNTDGYFVSVLAPGKEEEEASKYLLRSYDAEKDISKDYGISETKFSGVKQICIEKEQGWPVAKVVKCA
jgi:hypothetical protein